MAIQKEHKEFYTVDLDTGLGECRRAIRPASSSRSWPARSTRRTGTGFRTRHLRFKPGVYTTEPFVHEYWEEVYLVSGDLIVGCDAAGRGGEKFGPHTYACRPPGTPHGPFKSDTGCLLLELHYYDAHEQ